MSKRNSILEKWPWNQEVYGLFFLVSTVISIVVALILFPILGAQALLTWIGAAIGIMLGGCLPLWGIGFRFCESLLQSLNR